MFQLGLLCVFVATAYGQLLRPDFGVLSHEEIYYINHVAKTTWKVGTYKSQTITIIINNNSSVNFFWIWIVMLKGSYFRIFISTGGTLSILYVLLHIVVQLACSVGCIIRVINGDYN